MTSPESRGPASRPCPVCGSTELERLYQQRFAHFRAGSIADGYDVVACGSCGACFASGLPASARFDQYYADASKYDLQGGSEDIGAREVARFADQAAFVGHLVPDRERPVLDVGTASGGFLAALRAEGFTTLRGVEPSPDAVRVARERLGLEVIVGGLDAARRWGQFHLISWLAVLEHVLDPRALLRATAELLEPGGLLFVSVPDAGSFPDHARAPFQEFSVEHINFFTAKSMRNLMAAEGFEVIADRSLVLPLGADGSGPALEGAYRWTGRRRAPDPDFDGKEAVRTYIDRCETLEAGICDRIDKLAASGRRCYVWGTGTMALHLLERSRLSECAIEAFIDSNPHYAGATLGGRPVVAPASLARLDGPVVVTSIVNGPSIAAAARSRFGDDVELIMFDEAEA